MIAFLNATKTHNFHDFASPVDTPHCLSTQRLLENNSLLIMAEIPSVGIKETQIRFTVWVRGRLDLSLFFVCFCCFSLI